MMISVNLVPVDLTPSVTRRSRTRLVEAIIIYDEYDAFN